MTVRGSCDHRRRVRPRPAIEQPHGVHLLLVDTYPLFPTCNTAPPVISSQGRDGTTLTELRRRRAAQCPPVEPLSREGPCLALDPESDPWSNPAHKPCDDPRNKPQPNVVRYAQPAWFHRKPTRSGPDRGRGPGRDDAVEER